MALQSTLLSLERAQTPVSPTLKNPNVELLNTLCTSGAARGFGPFRDGSQRLLFLEQEQAASDLHLPPHHTVRSRLESISVVSSPIWTIDGSNDSHGPWLSRTLSIAPSPRHQSQPFSNTNGIINREPVVLALSTDGAPLDRRRDGRLRPTHSNRFRIS